MHIRNIAWIVIEDGDTLNNPTRRLIRRTRIAYCYIAAKRLATPPGRFFEFLLSAIFITTIINYFTRFENFDI